MRADYVISLTWDCINFLAKIIKIDKIPYRNNFLKLIFGTSKTSSCFRVIYIGETLATLLKSLKEDINNSTILLDAGANIKDIQRRLGNS